MKLSILCDNTVQIDRYFLAEPGFSAYVETGPLRILFDTGYSGVFMSNAGRLNNMPCSSPRSAHLGYGGHRQGKMDTGLMLVSG
ncbi:MAG: hypothetical protein KKI09_07185 [Spirochaetes bacterium]|nr:hypothetical protein [Spirochaetota bacterium]MBU0955194.1 hypothetical protein [Spirochaetota bacterium]